MACRLLAVAVLGSSCLWGAAAQADNTWVGGTLGDESTWELDSNWTSAPYPTTNAGALTFGPGGYSLVSCSNGVSGLTTVQITAPYTLMGGGTWSFNNGASLNLQCVGGSTVNLLNNLTAQGNLTMTVASTNSSPLKLQLGSGGINSIALNNGGTLTLNPSSSNDSFLLETRITGNGSLVTQGSGTVSLTAASTYSGSTTVQGGTLNLNCASALPSTTAMTIQSGGTLTTNYNQTVQSLEGAGTVSLGGASTVFTVDGSNSTTFSGSLSGVSGAGERLAKSGSGTLTLSGSVSNVGLTVNAGKLLLTGSTTYGTSTQTTINGGTLQIGDGTTNGSLTSSSILDNGSLVYNVAPSTTANYYGGISGSGALTKDGAGGLMVYGEIDNVAVTVNSGTLANTTNWSTNTGGLVNTALTVNSGGTMNFNSGYTSTLTSLSGNGTVNHNAGLLQVNNSSDCQFSGTWNGNSQNLIKTGSGTLTMSGTVNAMTLGMNAGKVIFSGSGSKTLTVLAGNSGSTVSLSDSILTLNDSASYTYNGNLATETGTTGTLVKAGAATLILGGNVSGIGLTVNSGAVLLENVVGSTKTITQLNGSGGMVLIDGTALTIDTASGTSASYAGPVTGSGTAPLVIKDGDGSQTLSGVVSSVGATVNGGTLTLGGTVSDVAATVNSGTLVFSGSGAKSITSLSGSGGTVRLNNATLTVNNSSNSTFSGALDVAGGASGTLVKSGTGTLTLGGTVSDVAATVNSGTLAFSGSGAKSLSSLSGSGGTVSLDSATLTIDSASGANDNYTGNVTGSGTATLMKDGVGSQTLSGYLSGLGVTVNGGLLILTGTVDGVAATANSAGTLNLSSGGINRLAGLAGSGTVNLSGSTIVSGSSDCTFSGTLNGNGGTVIQNGTGVLTLAGSVDNLTLYTDTTVRFSGSDSKHLTLLGGLNGSVLLNNSTLTIDSTSSGTYGFGGGLSAESGATGTLVKETSGAALLTGTISNVNLVVNQGTVTFSDPWFSPGTHPKSLASLSGTSSGAVTINGTTLTVNTASGTNATYAGSLNGASGGVLTKSGVGSQTLSGSVSDLTVNANGGTLTMAGTVSGVAASVGSSGTLVFSGSGSKSVSSLAGNGTVTLSDATLTVNNASDATFAGTLNAASGTTGTLAKSGAGTLTLSGAVSDIGLTISEGTLLVTGDATVTSVSGTGGTITFNGGSTLTDNSTGDTTYAGALTTGTFVKSGSGTLTLTGSGTTANLEVNDGTIKFNGVQTSGTTTVGAGGTLQGIGALANLVNHGMLAPGNSIGTLTVTGDFTSAAGSTLNIEINDAGQSDLLQVTGAATLNGGTVNVHAVSGAYTAGQNYTFLTAGSLSGTFETVTDDLAFLDAMLVYSSNSVGLTLVPSRDYVDAAYTLNQRGVASYLDAHKSTAAGDFGAVVDQLNLLTDAEAPAAFDAMSGEIYGSLATITLENEERFLQGVAQRLRNQSLARGIHVWTGDPLEEAVSEVSFRRSGYAEGSGWSPWCEGFGVGAQMASDGNASGLTYAVGGLSVGAERQYEEFLLGVMGGYGNTATALDARGDHGAIESGTFGVYLQRDVETHYQTAMATFGLNSYDATRQIAFGSIDRTARASYDGTGFAFYTEAGRNYRGRFLHWQPYLALEYLQARANRFVESGADSLDLTANGLTSDGLRGLLGSRAMCYFRTPAGHLFSLEGRAAWRHEFLSQSRLLDVAMVGPGGSPFAIAGANVDRDAALLGCGLSTNWTHAVKVYVNYDLLVGGNDTVHAGAAGLQCAW